MDNAPTEAWDQHLADLAEIHALFQALPDEMRQEFEAVTLRWCDIAERLQMPPRQVTVMLGFMMGAFAMAEARGEVYHDALFARYVVFAGKVVASGVANARMRAGWTPEGAMAVGHG